MHNGLFFGTFFAANVAAAVEWEKNTQKLQQHGTCRKLCGGACNNLTQYIGTGLKTLIVQWSEL